MTTIRPAQLEDAPALADLLREVGFFEAINAMSPDEASAHVRRHLSLSLADDGHSLFVGADQAGQILGYVAVHWIAYLFLPGPEGYVSELFLRPVARGKGLGAALLDVVQTEARQRGVYRLSLLNNRSRESYERGFYQKHGWEERTVMSNFVFWMEAH